MEGSVRPSIDLRRAQELFAASTDFTVGIEEEFAILDPGTLDLVGRFEALERTAREDPLLASSLCGELISSEVEIRSGKAPNVHEAIAQQRERRARLLTIAREHGVALAASGTHPWADYRDQRIIDTAHYRRVEEGLKYIAWRNNTFALHVHVGIRGADRAVRVCDRLRPVAPLLLAISASSPFLEGRESGLHSTRSQIFTKSFPRCGIPDAYGGWPAFRDYIDALVRTRSIVEYTQVWWSIRPHLSFGTVEFRLCDAQINACESEALATLIVACVAQAARDVDEGVPAVDLPNRAIEENFWRAIRHGQDGQLLDLDRWTEYPAAEALWRLLEWTAPVRGELGLEINLPELNGAQRQRRALEGAASLSEIYAGVVRETLESYARAAVAVGQSGCQEERKP